MTDPLAAYVTLTADNKARLVRYSRNLLVVKTILEGNLTPANSSRLFGQTRDPKLVKALQRGNLSSAVPTQGDQFFLTVRGESGNLEAYGFVQDAPPVVRKLIEDLLATGEQLKPTALAAAYLKSEPIPRVRYEALQTSSKVRFVAAQNFPDAFRKLVSSAVNSPRNFIPLNNDQYRTLLTQVSPGRELFISDKNSGHQLILFQARP